MCVRVCYLRRNLEEFEVDRAQQEPRLVDLHSQGKTARKIIITVRKISTNKNLVTNLIILEYYRFTPRG